MQRLRRLLGRRSARAEEDACVVEGRLLIAEAVAAGWSVEGQFVTAGTTPVPGVADVYILAPGVAERVSDVETPAGLFAIVTARRPPPYTLAHAGLVVVADGVGDPGNLGTILRSAEAAGADAVAVTPGTVDPTNPKVLRSSAGAAFHVPVVTTTLAEVAAAGLRTMGSSSHRGRSHTEADWSGRLAIVVGDEANGLDPDAPVDEWVRIEHRGRAESLNVAMAATVLCFEAARHRR